MSIFPLFCISLYILSTLFLFIYVRKLPKSRRTHEDPCIQGAMSEANILSYSESQSCFQQQQGGTKKILCFMLLFRGGGIKKPANQYLGLWSLLLTSKLLAGHWHCCCVACVYVYFNFFKNIGVKLFNKTVIVPDIHVSILPQTPFPSRLPHIIKQCSLYYTVGLCWLSILSIAVCTCPSQTPYRYPPFPLAIITLCCFFTMDKSCSGYSLGLNQYPLQKGTIY